MLCKVIIKTSVFPSFFIALINIVRLELLWHTDYQISG